MFYACPRKKKRWAPHCQVEIIYCLIKCRKLTEAKNLIEEFEKEFPINDENVNADILVLRGTVNLLQGEHLQAESCFQDVQAKYRGSSQLSDAVGRVFFLDPLHPFGLENLYRNAPRPISEELLRKLIDSFSASSEKFPGCVTLLRNLIYLHLDLLRYESTLTQKKRN